MRYVLALDQGTTSSRAIVFDEGGTIRGIDQREFAQHFPQEGWVEHDPDEIWQTQLATARGALERAGIAARDVTAIGITNQRETTIVWDRASGRPIAPAIVWQDRRTAGECERLQKAGEGERVTRTTGLLLDPYFSATKIAWLLDNVPGARERAERGELAFGTVDTWLMWNLTGGAVHATDHSNASRTLLLDIERLAWADGMLDLFRVPRSGLPDLRPSMSRFGIANASLLGAPIPITGVAGDQQAALFGQAGFRPGFAKNTYGTGSFVMLNTGARVVRPGGGLLATVAYTRPDAPPAYAIEGSIFITGAAVQWLRDGLQIVASAADAEALASSVADAGGVYFVPALTGLGAPYWDPYARGAIFGLTRGSTRAHVARAAIEAMGYQTADVLSAMLHEAAIELRELRVDGGASKNDLAMQFVADIIGVDVVRPRVTETTALGAAFMAGLQAGVWPDLDALSTLWAEDRRFAPAMLKARRDELLLGWRDAVDRTRTRGRT